MKSQKTFWTGFIVAALTACGSSSTPNTPTGPMTAEQMAKLGPTLPESLYGYDLTQCYDLFAEAEKKRSEANIHYMGYFQVPGYPYVRVDRLMASFAGNLTSEAQAGPWLEQMREYAAFARAVELRDAGMEAVERANLLHDLSLCSVWLSLLAFDQKEVRSRLVKAIRQSVSPPPEPIRKAPTKPASISGQELMAWQPVAPAEAASDRETNEQYKACDRDALGRLGLFPGGWQRLAARFAPVVRSPRQLVSPQFGENGQILNTGPAQINYQPSFIRAGGQTLLQFSYFIWTAHDRSDSEGFRGLIWRVTLGPDGTPLIYDSLNLDGTSHQWHPAQNALLQGDMARDKSLVGADQVTLTLAGDGSLLKASPQTGLHTAKARDLPMTVYDDLVEMPIPNGPRRSMFDSSGVLRVEGPPVYMLGQHPAINASGMAFDDPYLVDKVFKLNREALASTVPETCDNDLTITFAR